MDWNKEFKEIKEKQQNGNIKDFYDNLTYGELLLKSAEYGLKIKQYDKTILELRKDLQINLNYKEMIEVELSLLNRKLLRGSKNEEK